MRNNGNFSRTDEVSIDRSSCPDWLNSFANDMAIKEATATSKNAVEVARNRAKQPSVFDQISAIVSGSPAKHSSVEDVVKEYQHRAGLGSYKKSSLESLAEQIKSAEINVDTLNAVDQDPDLEVSLADDVKVPSDNNMDWDHDYDKDIKGLEAELREGLEHAERLSHSNVLGTPHTKDLVSRVRERVGSFEEFMGLKKKV
jgi:hypothetical protein